MFGFNHTVEEVVNTVQQDVAANNTYVALLAVGSEAGRDEIANSPEIIRLTTLALQNFPADSVKDLATVLSKGAKPGSPLANLLNSWAAPTP